MMATYGSVYYDDNSSILSWTNTCNIPTFILVKRAIYLFLHSASKCILTVCFTPSHRFLIDLLRIHFYFIHSIVLFFIGKNMLMDPEMRANQIVQISQYRTSSVHFCKTFWNFSELGNNVFYPFLILLYVCHFITGCMYKRSTFFLTTFWLYSMRVYLMELN